MTLIEESDRRCPWDGKRMMVERGQDDESRSVRLLAVHVCWHCDYVEREEAWRPRLTVVQGGRSGADRLKRARLGESDAS